MFSLIVIVFLLTDQYTTVAINTCNDNCLSKTYCISKDGDSVCSKDNLISVIFKLDQVDNKLYFSLTLTKYQLITNQPHHKITLILSSESVITKYHCKLISNVSRSFIFQNNYQFDLGSSEYSDNNLKCHWQAAKESKAWPFYYHHDDKHLILKDFLITLEYNAFNGTRSVILTNDSSELPFHRLQSLRCCNNVHESDRFVFIFHQKDDHINYYLQLFDSSSAVISILFTNSHGVKLLFTCNRQKGWLTSLLQDGKSVTSVIKELFSPRVDESSCSWITPLSLSYDANQLDLVVGNFDFKLISDYVVFYAEKNVKFEKIKEFSLSSGQPSLPPLTFAILISTYYLQLVLNW